MGSNANVTILKQMNMTNPKETLDQEKNRLQKRALKMAVDGWERRKKGIYPAYEEKRYSQEYCDEQIEYFKNFKFK